MTNHPGQDPEHRPDGPPPDDTADDAPRDAADHDPAGEARDAADAPDRAPDAESPNRAEQAENAEQEYQAEASGDSDGHDRPSSDQPREADTAAHLVGLEETGDESAGDTDNIQESPEEASAHSELQPDYEHVVSARRVAVELKRIESEVREILERLDTRRKRRLTGTRRWYDLQEDMINWQFAGKFDPDTFQRLQQLVNRRHYLFRRLRFLSGTRPTWNS